MATMIKVTDEQILQVFRENPGITQVDAAKILGITSPGLNQRCQKLKKENKWNLVPTEQEQRELMERSFRARDQFLKMNRRLEREIKALEKIEREGGTPEIPLAKAKDLKLKFIQEHRQQLKTMSDMSLDWDREERAREVHHFKKILAKAFSLLPEHSKIVLRQYIEELKLHPEVDNDEQLSG